MKKLILLIIGTVTVLVWTIVYKLIQQAKQSADSGLIFCRQLLDQQFLIKFFAMNNSANLY